MADTIVTRVATPVYLQNFAIGFRPRGMVADLLSPRLPVVGQEGKYRKWGRNLLVPQRAERAPLTPPNRAGLDWTLGTFYITEYALREPLSDEERNNNTAVATGGIENLEGRVVQFVTGRLVTSREQRIATQFTTAGNYPGANVITKAGGAEWDTGGAANVFADLQSLLGTVALSAMVPQEELTVVIPQMVFDSIANNSAFLSRIQYTQPTSIAPDILARMLRVRRVLVASSMVGSAAGVETAGADPITGYTPSYAWKDTVWAGYVDDTNNDFVPTFARTFENQELLRVGAGGATGGGPAVPAAGMPDTAARQVRTYRIADEGQRGTWYEVAEALDEQITFNGAGGIIVNTLSTI